MSKKHAPTTLDRDEWNRIFAQADCRYPTGRRDFAAYNFMYFTGLRVGELCNLRFDQVNLRGGWFVVPRDGKTGERKLGIPKSPRLYDMLESWLETRAEWRVDSPYFFCARNGSKLDEKNVAHTLKRRALKAGISKRVHPHAMRHSYASERAREGVTPAILMNELGHTSLQTTTLYLRALGDGTVDSMRERVID